PPPPPPVLPYTTLFRSDHHLVEGGGDLTDRRPAASVSGLARGNGQGDPPAHLLRRLGHLAAFAREVALPEHSQGGFGPFANLCGAGFSQHANPPSGQPGQVRPKLDWDLS